LGLICLVLGIVLKFFVVGFKISNLFSKKENVSEKEVKKIFKEEVSKEGKTNSSKNKKTK